MIEDRQERRTRRRWRSGLMGESNDDCRWNFPQDWVVSDTGQVNQQAVRSAPSHSQRVRLHLKCMTRGELPRPFLTFFFFFPTRRSLVLSKYLKPNERWEIRGEEEKRSKPVWLMCTRGECNILTGVGLHDRRVLKRFLQAKVEQVIPRQKPFFALRFKR